MASYWKIVNRVIEKSDIILEVLDARLIDETRNPEVEERAKGKHKTLLYVINKSDLADKKMLESAKKHLRPAIFISSRQHLGTTMLRDKILQLAGKPKVTVGVVGYPNTGKSSVINALAGRSKAGTSPQSGHTKGLQRISAGSRITLLDTPGVIPFLDKDATRHAMISAVDASRLDDPDIIAMELIQKLDGAIEKYYGVERQKDPEKVLVSIAVKNHRLGKRGVPDTELMSRIIIRHWQQGKIKV